MIGKINVWRNQFEPWDPYPWRFSVTFNGAEHYFCGIPNHCKTKHGAYMRGWRRLKWFKDGTYHRRYVKYE